MLVSLYLFRILLIGNGHVISVCGSDLKAFPFLLLLERLPNAGDMSQCLPNAGDMAHEHQFLEICR